MKKLGMLVLFITSLTLEAQNLDSLYNMFVNIRSGSSSAILQNRTESGMIENDKCAFGLVNRIIANYDQFSPEQKKVLQKILARPETDTSIVSPSGLFRIHFNKSDYPDYVPNDIRTNLTSEQLSNYKKIYLDSLAIAADSSFNYEVNILNYPAPPSDGYEGGDGKYDIYIQALTSNTYGYTQGETPITDSTFTSYMVIDNDFANYYTTRIYAARVTIAHEFHHAIQMGNYILRFSDQFYYELTSVSMEEFVFDNVNDYYNDLRTFMKYPQRSFAANDGYDLAIWNLFLRSEFDVNIIKRTWEFMGEHDRALISVADAIAERGSSFKNEFAKFGLWLYFTGPRALPGKYFEEAANYPLVTPLISMEFSASDISKSVSVSSSPLSTNILFFQSTNGSETDTLVSIISNTDLTNGVNNIYSTTGFTYTLSQQSGQDFRFIIDDYYSKIESDGDFLLSESNVFKNFPVNNGQVISTEIDYAYPQPFRYSRDRFIYFPVSLSQQGTVDLSIYSADMRRVYSGQTTVLALDKAVVQWNCMNNSGGKLNSGVYFYVIKSGDIVKKGKFVILND